MIALLPGTQHLLQWPQREIAIKEVPEATPIAPADAFDVTVEPQRTGWNDEERDSPFVDRNRSDLTAIALRGLVPPGLAAPAMATSP